MANTNALSGESPPSCPSPLLRLPPSSTARAPLLAPRPAHPSPHPFLPSLLAFYFQQFALAHQARSTTNQSRSHGSLVRTRHCLGWVCVDSERPFPARRRFVPATLGRSCCARPCPLRSSPFSPLRARLLLGLPPLSVVLYSDWDELQVGQHWRTEGQGREPGRNDRRTRLFFSLVVLLLLLALVSEEI